MRTMFAVTSFFLVLAIGLGLAPAQQQTASGTGTKREAGTKHDASMVRPPE